MKHYLLSYLLVSFVLISCHSSDSTQAHNFEFDSSAESALQTETGDQAKRSNANGDP